MNRVKPIERALNDTLSDDGLVDYVMALKLTRDDLNGTILDLGSGLTNRFAREIGDFQKIGRLCNANVVAINPQLGCAEIIESNNIPIGQHSRSVAGLSQELPLRSDSFDRVLSVMAIPRAIDDLDIPICFQEIRRVLKPGGRAKIWPIHFPIEMLGYLGVDYPEEFSLEKTDQNMLRSLDDSFLKCTDILILNKPD